MSGPDRRDTKKVLGMVGGADPEFGGDEEYVPQIVSHRRAYHIRADVKATFSAGQESPVGYVVSDGVEPEFKGRASLYEWNGQEVLDSDDSVRVSRAEYIALDVAGEFIEEED